MRNWLHVYYYRFQNDEPGRQTVEIYASAIAALIHLYTYDLDLWPLTLKTFSVTPNQHYEYLWQVFIGIRLPNIQRYIASRKIDADRRTEGRTDSLKTQSLRRLLLAKA